MKQPPPAEPTSQEPFYAPARPACDQQDPRNLLPEPLTFIGRAREVRGRRYRKTRYAGIKWHCRRTASDTLVTKAGFTLLKRAA